MVRIGVFSDTHGDISRIEEAIAQMGSLDYIFHAGDYLKDAEAIAKMTGIPVKGVLGNCDSYHTGPQEEVVTIEGVKILLTHGHRYKVKYAYVNLSYRAEELGVNLVVFGHTHIAEKINFNNIVLFNPGSIAFPRRSQSSTYGLLEIGKNGFKTHIFTCQG